MTKIGVEGEEALNVRFMQLMNNIQSSGNDIESAIRTTFGDLINGSTEAYETILNAYAEATGIGILNMGQNLDKLENSIDDFYKKATD